MDPTLVGIGAMVLMLALIAIGVPIGFALGVVGVAGNVLVIGLPQTALQIQLIAWETGNNFLLIAAPLFILMGQLVYHAGIATDLYDCTHKWFGRLPGGLAVTSVITSAAFGAVTGSSIAAVHTMGSMVIPEMKRYKYDMRLATGSVAAAGTLAILIPPSITLVIYGVWTETSIGQLFIAGVIPGIILAVMFCGAIIARCIANPELGPRGPRYPLRERMLSLSKLMPTAVVFVIVLGGIYGGIFTPSEASAAGVVGVLAVALVMRRLTWRRLGDSLHQAGIVSAMIFVIIVGGVLLSRFLVQTDVTSGLVGAIGNLEVHRYIIILLFVVMYLILGAILDVFGMIILTLPFVFPIILDLGFDAVWFGIFITVMVELALITPPIGLNVYVMKNVVPDVDVMDIFRGCVPFVGITLIFVLLLLFVPEIALWLPSTMR